MSVTRNTPRPPTITQYDQYSYSYNPIIRLDDLDLDQFGAPGGHIGNICCNLGQKCQFDIWPWVTLDDLDLDLSCAPGVHIINICWNMVKKINLTFDLEWPWPWLILCTMVSYNQYMLKYGQKMSIWPLTLSDLGWPWPWPWLILCTRVSYYQYMLKYGQKMSIWPLTLSDLDLDLGLFCAPGCHIINICWNMVKKCQFDLWPWVTLDDLDLD